MPSPSGRVFPVVPPLEEFPYTIRLVSEVLSSNGSTSMASVCSSTLSLMDAGVPIKAPVAGIAMGLVYADGEYVTLTDILGAEDAYGDMDFKVAGTSEFVTALQLDTKIDGIPADVLAAARRRRSPSALRRPRPGAGSRTLPGSRLASLRGLDGPPDGLRRVRHVEMSDAERAERVHDRVGHRGGARDRARLADALDPDRVDR